MSNRITVIGAGNGGQAIAGYCASRGYDVCLFCRDLSKSPELVQHSYIKLHGALNAEGKLAKVTDSFKEAAEFSNVIMVVTTATAHGDVAQQLAPYLGHNHIIVLNPGRTLGALEFKSILDKSGKKDVVVAEAQTLVYACRLNGHGSVNVIGVKNRVPIVATNKQDTDKVLNVLGSLFPCFETGQSMLQIGLENIGAIFHPAVVLFNAATIERNNSFYFYRDMTPQIARFIHELDAERIKIGRAYGIDLMPVEDWIVYAYPETKGDTLCERMRNNPAYYDILAPGSIFTRQLTEDIPTGIVPMRDLGKIAGVKTPIMDAIITISSILLNKDFEKSGRNYENLNLSKYSFEEVIKILK